MMIDAAYWSEITLLGSTSDSDRSFRLNRPATCDRSGPVAPPSPANRWHTAHRAAEKARSPFLKSRPALSLPSSATRSAVVHSLPGPIGFGGAGGLYALRRPRASIASLSVSVALANASLSMLLRNPW